jgi:hypothetical protein
MNITYKHLPKHKKFLVQMNGGANRYCYEVRYEIEVDQGERIVEGINILKKEMLNSEDLTKETLAIFNKNFKQDYYRIFRLLSVELINAYYIKPDLLKGYK